MDDKLPRHIAWFAPWTWKNRWMVLRLTVLFMFVGYLISVGPMYGLMMQGRVSPAVYHAIYAPLIWVTKQWRPFSALLWWYTSFFQRR